MRKNFNFNAVLLGFSFTTLSLSPAYADDTDIFLGRVSAGTIRPNVLFILDNSGSMDNATSSSNSTSRLQTMKNSMDSILSNVEGINAGLMRFNDPGGSILYPVTNLDDPVVKNWILSAQISQSADDAAQSLASVGGFSGGGDSSIDLSSDELVFGAQPANLTDATFSISNGDDDAEETLYNGDISRTGSILNMDSSQINAMRFQNVTVPIGANIISAELELTSSDNDTGDSTLRLYAENIANSPALSSSDDDISDRTKTTNFTEWQPDNWSDDNHYTSPDMSAVIQEVVGNIGWASGNALTIIQTHESGNDRRAKSYNNSSSEAAKLHISYQPLGGGYEHQRIGLRFQNVTIPRGATVTKAYIALTPSKTNTPDAGLPMEIQLEDVGDAGEFTTTAGDLTAASYLSSISWTAGDWVQDQTVQTPSLVSAVQQIVNRGDWCGGNAMAFSISPTSITTLSRSAYSFDDGTSREPRLVVEYDPDTVPVSTCNQMTLTYQISGQPNDAEETNSSGDVTNDGQTMNMHSGQTNGYRFENIPLVQGATIIEANLTFTSKDNDSSADTITFEVEDSSDPANFPESNSNLTNRTKVSGVSVNWNSSSSPALGSWSTDNKYTSPDLTSLVQAVVNRGDWNQADNAIVFLQTSSATSSNERRTYSYDDSPAGSAVLTIKVNSTDTNGGSSGITVRDHLKSLVDNLDAETYTPIVDSLYEAARYYRGDSVFWGLTRDHSPHPVNGVNYSSNTDDKWKRVSDMESIQSGTGTRVLPSGCSDDDLDDSDCEDEYISGSPIYESPITESCQANYIVLLTDGEANQNHSESLIKSYISQSGDCSNTDDDESCSEELVEWMSNNDMSSTEDGDNTVHTFTIAFALDDDDAIDYLDNLAHVGGGKHYQAGSESQLTDAFNNIIAQILQRDATFVVPGTTVSQFNRLSHFEDVYFSVFKPSRYPRWDGNLKKYKISQTSAKFGRVVGQNDELAVDDATGFFKEGVTSFWSDTSDPDGPEVTKGGAAYILDDNPDNRHVYTYYSGGSTTLSSNPLDESNTDITKAMLGIASESDDYRENLLNWARGEDYFDVDDDGSTDDGRYQFGDPLHSEPVAITYGGTSSNPDFAVFFATNDGYLHAVNGATGDVYFSFIPGNLLPNLRVLFDNAVTDEHPYGIDGSITRWVYDDNKDGIIDASDGDHVYIYFGLRRGGSYYYALDVTDRASPKLMWQIDGITSPFDEIGQSWSQPLKAAVSIDVSGTAVEKEVLIFGGGYDPDQDDASTITADDEGRAIYMVEAGYPTSGTTPAIVWRAGNSSSYDLNLADMDYSIPGLIKAGDTNGDGLVDVMFTADMGGQIWRFDINNGQPVSSLVTGAVIADFSGTTAADARRFYASIDAATLAYRGQRFITLSIGSGWRANPLDEVVDDRFYMIRQSIGNPGTYTKLTESDLYDATANLAGSSDPTVAAQAQMDLNAASGWYIQLTLDGEKVLSPSITANAQILFTTYQPNAQTDPCNPDPGVGWLYGVNALNATPFLEDVNGDLTRSVQLDSGNIPPTPTLLVLPDGTTRTLVGPEEAGELIQSNPIHKTYWFDQ